MQSKSVVNKINKYQALKKNYGKCKKVHPSVKKT